MKIYQYYFINNQISTVITLLYLVKCQCILCCISTVKDVKNAL